MRVAVVGAGVGGLSVAAATRGSGHDVTLYEQVQRVREVGAGVALGANGSRLLRRWGLGEGLRKVAVQPRRVQFHRWATGEPYLSHGLADGDYEARFKAPFYTVHRSDLHDLLWGAVGHLVRGAARCVAVAERADSVRLSFEDGGSATADLVVGADGVHSVVRRELWGADALTFSGASGLRGLVPVSALSAMPGFDPADPALWLFPGPGRHFICYPVRGGSLVNYLAVVPGSRWHRESWTARGSVAQALTAFQGWNPVVTQLLRHTNVLGRWALYDREPLPRWSSGRVTLLGDAAHPMLPHHGQGANQAIEDAAVLADCLQGCDGDLAGVGEALSRYEGRRRARTRLLQLGSRRNGECFQVPDGPLARERDARLVNLPDDVAWIHGHDAQDCPQPADQS